MMVERFTIKDVTEINHEWLLGTGFVGPHPLNGGYEMALADNLVICRSSIILMPFSDGWRLNVMNETIYGGDRCIAELLKLLTRREQIAAFLAWYRAG